MKIVHIIHSLDPLKGGTTEALRSLATACVKEGHSSEIITLDAPDCVWLEEWKIPVFAAGPARTHYGWSAKLRAIINERIKEASLVVVHGLWQYHCGITRKACLDAKKPYVVYPHGMLDPWALKQNPLKRIAKNIVWLLSLRKVLVNAARICFTCQEELDAALPALNGMCPHYAVVPLGVEGPPDSISQLKAEFLTQHPRFEGLRMLLFLGRLHPKKGCDHLLQGFAKWKAQNKGQKVHLRMVGPAYSQAYLKHLLGMSAHLSLEIDKDISFPGMTSGRRKWNEIAVSEALILPSFQENFGLVVGEALACGKLALLSDRVNTWNWVTSAAAGFVAQPNTAGVLSLLDQWSLLAPDALNEYDQRARQLFAANFSLKSCVNHFITLARSLDDAH